jgi:arginyl-tRNA synthetase
MSMPSQLELLEATIKEAISRAIQANSLSGAVPDSIKLERPKERSHGDYATSIALQISKPMGKNPREVAQVILDQLTGIESINKVEIAGPGFINITLNRASQAQLVETIVAAKDAYGIGKSLSGIKINLEFISANPTGPLHLGHTRWAAVGDALGRVLTAAGARVTREFYINDRGNQMDLFGQSVEAVALGQHVPENGYQGDYIKD